MTTAYEMLARARGVVPDAFGSRCWLCGRSPFGRGEQPSASTATWWDRIVDPQAGGVCEGCASLLAGRPGDDPPPARTTSVLAVDGKWRTLSIREVWDVLDEPPDRPHVLSWSESRKQHHWMHAGVSTSTRQLVGSDTGQIEHVPERDRPLLDAVLGLLASEDEKRPAFPRATILAGDYSPSRITAFGAPRWAALEGVVARYRGGRLLALIVAAAPVRPLVPSEDDDMIDENDSLAADLLAAIVRGSERRRTAGLEFWGGELRHRIERVRRLPLADMISRLGDDCDVPGNAMAEAMSRLRGLSDEQSEAVRCAFRDRPKLVESLAFEAIRRAREEATCELS